MENHASVRDIILRVFRPEATAAGARTHYLRCLKCASLLQIRKESHLIEHFNRCCAAEDKKKVHAQDMRSLMSDIRYVPVERVVTLADGALKQDGYRCPSDGCEFATVLATKVTEHIARKHPELKEKPWKCTVAAMTKMAGGSGYSIVRDENYSDHFRDEFRTFYPTLADPPPPPGPSDYFADFYRSHGLFLHWSIVERSSLADRLFLAGEHKPSEPFVPLNREELTIPPKTAFVEFISDRYLRIFNSMIHGKVALQKNVWDASFMLLLNQANHVEHLVGDDGDHDGEFGAFDVDSCNMHFRSVSATTIKRYAEQLWDFARVVVTVKETPLMGATDNDKIRGFITDLFTEKHPIQKMFPKYDVFKTGSTRLLICLAYSAITRSGGLKSPNLLHHMCSSLRLAARCVVGEVVLGGLPPTNEACRIGRGGILDHASVESPMFLINQFAAMATSLGSHVEAMSPLQVDNNDPYVLHLAGDRILDLTLLPQLMFTARINLDAAISELLSGAESPITEDTVIYDHRWETTKGSMFSIGDDVSESNSVLRNFADNLAKRYMYSTTLMRERLQELGAALFLFVYFNGLIQKRATEVSEIRFTGGNDGCGPRGLFYHLNRFVFVCAKHKTDTTDYGNAVPVFMPPEASFRIATAVVLIQASQVRTAWVPVIVVDYSLIRSQVILRVPDVGRLFPPILERIPDDPTPVSYVSAKWCRSQVEQHCLNKLGFRVYWNELRKSVEYISRSLAPLKTKAVVRTFLKDCATIEGDDVQWSSIEDAIATAVMIIAADNLSVTGMGHSVKVASTNYSLSSDSLRNVDPQIVMRALGSQMWLKANMDALLRSDRKTGKKPLSGAPMKPMRTKLTAAERKRLLGSEDVTLLPFQEAALISILEQRLDTFLLVRPGGGKSMVPYATAVMHPGMIIFWVVPYTALLRATHRQCKKLGIKSVTSSSISELGETEYLEKILGATIVLVTPEGMANEKMLKSFNYCIKNKKVSMVFLDDIHEVLGLWRRGYNWLNGPLPKFLQQIYDAPDWNYPPTVFASGTCSPLEYEKVLRTLGRVQEQVVKIVGEVFCNGIELNARLLDGDAAQSSFDVGYQMIAEKLKAVERANELNDYAVLVFVRRKTETEEFAKLQAILDADPELNGKCEVRRYYAQITADLPGCVKDCDPVGWLAEPQYKCRVIVCTTVLGVGVDVAAVRSVFVLGAVGVELSLLLQIFSRCARKHDSYGASHLVMTARELDMCKSSVKSYLSAPCRRSHVDLHLTGTAGRECGAGPIRCDKCRFRDAQVPMEVDVAEAADGVTLPPPIEEDEIVENPLGSPRTPARLLLIPDGEDDGAEVVVPPSPPQKAASLTLKRQVAETADLNQSVSSAIEACFAVSRCPVCWADFKLNNTSAPPHSMAQCPKLKGRCIRCQSKTTWVDKTFVCEFASQCASLKTEMKDKCASKFLSERSLQSSLCCKCALPLSDTNLHAAGNHRCLFDDYAWSAVVATFRFRETTGEFTMTEELWRRLTMMSVDSVFMRFAYEFLNLADKNAAKRVRLFNESNVLFPLSPSSQRSYLAFNTLSRCAWVERVRAWKDSVPPPLALSTAHPLPMFDPLEFDEETHTYALRQGNELRPISYSVTQLVGEFFDKFDQAKVIQSVMDNPRRQTDRTYKYFAMTFSQVKECFEDASSLGTLLHACVEHYYNGNQLPKDIVQIFPEYQQFLDFAKWANDQGYVPYRCETRVFSESLDLAGSVDMLFTRRSAVLDASRPTELYMFDWKRTMSVDSPSSVAVPKLRQPFETCLVNNTLSKYTLQLNFYKYMLEQSCNVVVKEMHLCLLHPMKDAFDVVPIRDLSTHVAVFMAKRQAEVFAKLISGVDF